MLLNIAYEDQVEIQQAVEKQSKIVIRNWGKSKLKNSVILLTGPKKRREIFIWFLYLDMPKDKRDEQVKFIAAETMDECNLSRALVLGSNLSRNHYPYSFIALINKNSD